MSSLQPDTCEWHSSRPLSRCREEANETLWCWVCWPSVPPWLYVPDLFFLNLKHVTSALQWDDIWLVRWTVQDHGQNPSCFPFQSYYMYYVHVHTDTVLECISTWSSLRFGRLCSRHMSKSKITDIGARFLYFIFVKIFLQSASSSIYHCFFVRWSDLF